MVGVEINAQFRQVIEFIDKTSRSVFLTGKAGTGKTTLLKHIRKNTYKQMAVCAPTGVAAINAGGSTIHSFFQFPFTPFIPRVKENGDIDASAANLPTLKYNTQRLAIFRSLELLVIDEISMVRADLLDQIDITLRYTRRKWSLPFGGVQLLLIGDMHQLPPVMKPDEWQILRPHYKSLFFFDSHVITRHPPVYVELDKVYRQADQTFIGLLNKVRHNELDEEARALLDARYKDRLTDDEKAGGITLTTHNHKADEINAANLHALPGKAYTFSADVTGVFPEKNYPAPDVVVLKAGARVMFLKNNPDKNYYNGKVGIVTEVEKDTVTVKCDEDSEPIRVTQQDWPNISYKVDKATHQISEETLGTFSQLPLRLAWAITIHKSQGLTFDRVIIDAAEAFSSGQVYVALSRCRSLEGLTLTSRIGERGLANDEQVLSFSKGRHDEQKLHSVLKEARHEHVRSLIDGLFDLSSFAEARKELAALVQVHGKRLNARENDWMNELFTMIDQLHAVSQKFRTQLASIWQQGGNPENDEAIQQRLKKAVEWFSPQLHKLWLMLKNCPLSVENKEAAMEFNEILQPVYEQVHTTKEMMGAVVNGFSFERFIKSRLSIVYPSSKVNVYATASNSRADSNVKHPALYRRLLLLRDEICNDEHLPVYMVANSKSLTELANYMPASMDEILCISGFGQARAEAFGEQFLSVIREYKEEHGIEDAPFQGPKKKNARPKKEKVERAKKPAELRINTRDITLQMFRQGKTPEEIAAERGFVTGTILSHLVPFVASGELRIDSIVSPDKQALISKSLEDFQPEQGLAHIKSQLPDEITFADIRMVLAHRDRMKADA